ncbi:MAG TPA: 4Fe-4S binding protein [Acidimicrobiia bacterium]|nr:4Fe-4S binding protein [Acidimicrobiia bacterium]
MSGLCARPEPIRELAAGADRLVLGLCRGRYSVGDVQREVRRAGLDPLGIEIVDLDDAGGESERLELILAAATARAEAFTGSRPEQTKLSFPGHASRRALLTFSIPEYQAAPAIDESRCAAARGCHACVEVCPRGAITLVGGRVRHDRSNCEPCGRCVTACPTGAVENPAATPAQVEAQVPALLDPSIGPTGPRGIVYRCRRSDRAEIAPGWYPVTVPCTGMLAPAWLLAPLLLGAGSVAARPCAAGGCPLAHDDLVLERVQWCREFLAAAGQSPFRIVTNPETGAPLDPVAAAAPLDPFGPLGAAGVLAAVAETTGTDDLLFTHPDSPLGLVEIDPTACTGCATCAAACPTGALVGGDQAGRRSITFDASRCVACGLCMRRCPEVGQGAIQIRPVVDVRRLREGRMRLFGSDLVTCRSCGGPLAPAAMLSRIGGLIDDARIMAVVGGSCSSCRGVPVGV